MNYESSLQALSSRNEFSIKLGLENIQTLLQLLGNPHKLFPSIHIAGTNGKGSVACFAATILKQAGYRTGLYTSPHLIEFRERIQINGKMISKKRVLEGLKNIFKKIDALQSKNKTFSPTYFEIVTALAFDTFAKEKIDIALIETGLGGKWDSTNVCLPKVCVITQIAKDHQKYLGKDLKSISLEKGGIIKKNVPVVVSVNKKIPVQVLTQLAQSKKAKMIHSSSNFNHIKNDSLENERFHFKNNGWEFLNLKTKMLGSHQIENASAALAALGILNQEGFTIPESAVRKGLSLAQWPGRFHVWQKNPPLILDGAHNVEGLKRLFSNLKEKNCLSPIFIFGMMKDKETGAMIQLFKNNSDTLFLTQSQTIKSLSVSDLAIKFQKAQYKGRIFTYKNVSTALFKAQKRASQEKRALVVCGSLYVVGEALSALKHDQTQ